MFNKLSLGFKIMGGFALVTVVTLIVGIVGFVGVESTNKSLKDISQNFLPSIQALLTIQKNRNAIVVAERSLLLTQSSEEIAHQKGRLDSFFAEVDAAWKIYDPLWKGNEEDQEWQQLKTAWAAWKNSHDQVMAYIYEMKPESLQKAKALSLGDARKLYGVVDGHLAKLVKMNEDESAKATKDADFTGLLLKSITIASVIIGIIVALMMGFLLSRAITKPVDKIIGGLKEGSQQVASASIQLSDSSQQLAEGNSELAASIEETSSTLEESSSMIRQNSENTRQAALLAAQTRQSAEKGTQEMSEMMGAMDELRKSSNQIAKIIKVIDDIAFQTNILALNAAVEAARAGDAGLGFAVVAEEVRNLAQRSAQAAKDTAEMIETNIRYSQNGLDTAQRVGGSLSEITAQAKKVNELVDEIAAAGQEQAQGIIQINKAIAQMEKATQQSAATAEESSASAQELNAQAEIMQEAVRQLVQVVKGTNEALDTVYRSAANTVRKPVKRTALPAPQSQNRRSRVVNPEEIIPLNDDTQDF